MPFSASSASYDSVLFGAAMAAAQGNDATNDETDDASKATTATEATSATTTDELIDLSFEKLVYNGKDIVSEADAADVKPKADEKVTLYYKFKTKDMLPDEQFKFKLPQQLLLYDESKLSGFIMVGTEKYFEYTTNKETREVTMTAVKAIPEGFNGGIYFSAVFGNFQGDSLEQTLEVTLPGKETLELKFEFQPKVSGQNISKEGTVRAVNGEKFIDWEVWFNLNGQDLQKEVTFTDTLGEGLELVPNSVNVSTAQVKPTLEGVSIVEGTEKVVSSNSNALTFTVNPGGKNAVKVTYQTKVTREASQEEELFTNTAVITGEGLTPTEWKVEKTVPVIYGKPLAKQKVGGDKYNANWKIEFNRLGKVVTTGTQIVDTIQGDNIHEMKADSIVVKKYVQENGEWKYQGVFQQGTDYDITVEGKKFVITLKNQDAIYAVDVEYTTTATEEFITSSGAVDNKVQIFDADSDKSSYEISTEFNYPEGIGTKQLADIDYTNRTLEWRVVFNTEGKEVNGFTIADTFTKGLKLKKYEDGQFFKVTSGENAKVTFEDVKEGAEGFSVTSTTPFTGTFIFTYKTSYDVLEQYGTDNTFKNNVSFKWNGENVSPNNISKSAEFTPKETHKKNADKTGSYNYAAREFMWTSAVNLDRNTLPVNTEIVDTLGKGHTIIASSIEVYEATIDKNGNVVKGNKTTDFNITPNTNELGGFVAKTTAQTDKTYVFEYKTKDSDDVIGQKDGGGTYENTIKIGTDGKFGGTSKSVTIDRPNELINKTHKQTTNERTISWTVDVNASGSLLKNAVLTDTLSSGKGAKQYLLPETIAIHPLTFTKEGIDVGNAVTLQEAVDKKWLTHSIAEGNLSFTLTFGDLTDKETPEAFRVTYKTYYDGPDNEPGAYGNSAVITSSGQDLPGATTSS